MNLPPQEFIFKINNYDELALKTFIRGLPRRKQDMVRLRNLNSLELATSLVLEKENFVWAQKHSSIVQNASTWNKPNIPLSFNSNQPNFVNVKYNQNIFIQFPITHNWPYVLFPKPNFNNSPFLSHHYIINRIIRNTDLL